MPWPSWESAALAALLSLAVRFFIRRRRAAAPEEDARTARRTEGVLQALQEFALLAGLYGIWQLARKLPITREDGAFDRARSIERIERWLHLPSEISAQHLILEQSWIAGLVNYYYAIVHVPATILFLVWAFVRHRDRYPHWRNGLAIVTAGCLVIRFVRVAPPRFITELGFVDLSQQYGLSVYGPVGTGISDQFAAMPSIHVGWAAVVALGAFALTTSRWRWLVLMHLPVTLFVVAATGHHWWLDGIVAIGILVVGLKVDTLLRNRGKGRGGVGPALVDNEPAAEHA